MLHQLSVNILTVLRVSYNHATVFTDRLAPTPRLRHRRRGCGGINALAAAVIDDDRRTLSPARVRDADPVDDDRRTIHAHVGILWSEHSAFMVLVER